MATFLQLVQKTARQSGTLAGGTTVSSVAGVSGRADKLVNWVSDAYLDIQNQRDQWAFLRGEFTSALVINTLRYTGASFSLSRLAEWVKDTPSFQPLTIYDSAIGASDETALHFIPFQEWRERWDRGSHDAVRPTEYSISHAGELCIGAKPDAAYVIRGEYVKTPQVLAANGDTPEMPERFHDIIVHRAMMMMGNSDESIVTIQTAQQEYQRLFKALCRDQLPDIVIP